jgi:rubrerythrin
MQTFEDFIEFAIKREEEAIKAYGDIAGIAKTPGLKKLLLDLQEEERNHKKLLQDITEEKIESLEIKEVADMKISDYLIEETPRADMNFQDILILAAKKEHEFLVQQEKSHKLKLEEEYEKHVLEGY